MTTPEKDYDLRNVLPRRENTSQLPPQLPAGPGHLLAVFTGFSILAFLLFVFIMAMGHAHLLGR